jgi:hypothetical protein
MHLVFHLLIQLIENLMNKMLINKYLKKRLLFFFRIFQRKLYFFNLSENESRGYCENYFWFKIFRSQRHFNYENGLTVGGVSFNKTENDPLGLAISKIFPSAQASEQTFTEILAKNYEIDKKMSAAQILGLDPNHESAKYPIWAMVYPWDSESMKGRFERYPNALIKNRAIHGLNFSSSDHKYIIEKCYSVEAAKIEAKQCIRLLKKIQRYGFIETDMSNLPHVLILKKENCWKWVMGVEGGHRSYINYLLKNPLLFAEVINIVDISKATKWKNVQNGFYTLDEAKYIFNLVFKGEVRTRGAI